MESLKEKSNFMPNNMNEEINYIENKISEVKEKQEANNSMREINKEYENQEQFINEGKQNLDTLLPGTYNPNPELSPIKSIRGDSPSPSPSPKKYIQQVNPIPQDAVCTIFAKLRVKVTLFIIIIVFL